MRILLFESTQLDDCVFFFFQEKNYPFSPITIIDSSVFVFFLTSKIVEFKGLIIYHNVKCSINNLVCICINLLNI